MRTNRARGCALAALALAIFALMLPGHGSAAPTSAPSGFLGQWGVRGGGPGQFNNPVSLAVAPSGDIYVADTDNARIQRFDRDGRLLGQWSTAVSIVSIGGAAPAPVVIGGGPEAIAVDARFVYALPRYARQIELFTLEGQYAGSIGGPPPLPPLAVPQPTFGYYSVAADGAGNVYAAGFVSDSNPEAPRSYSVRRFDSSGALVEEWGRRFEGAATTGRLTYGAPLAVAPSGHVYVINGDRIEKLDPSGALLGAWGAPGRGEGEFMLPFGISVDRHGDVYVAEADRVQKFDADGAYLGEWGSQGKGPGQFRNATGVAVGPAGDIYVADRGNHRIQRFSAAAVGSPVLGKQVNAKPVDGFVYVTRRGSGRRVQLSGAEPIPVGSLLDTRYGTVRIRSAVDRAGNTRSAEFHGGKFTVAQAKRPGAVTEVRLAGRLRCPGGAAGAARTLAAKPTRGRLVWGDGGAGHRSSGRNSAASVRGTRWLVWDRCDGTTMTRVAEGTVRVRDFVAGRTVTVRRGGSYVAGR